HSCQGCNVRPAIFAASIASNPSDVSGVNLRSGFVHKRGVVLPSLLRSLTAFPLEIVNRVHLHTFTQAQPFTTSTGQTKRPTILQKRDRKSTRLNSSHVS